MLLKNDIKNLRQKVFKDSLFTKKEELLCYAEDSTNLNNVINTPEAVIFVETIEQVQSVLRYANEHCIPVVSRGAGTNMVGACTCPKGGIVLNFSRMNKILDFNPIDMTITVQPGALLGDIKNTVDLAGLFYPPDPSNYKVSTIGGSIAQSSGGAMGFKYGTTKDYILSLKVVLADGTLMQLGKGTIKDAVGYHLNQLIIGSEGTLAVVVEAVLKLIPAPESMSTVLAYFDSYKDVSIAVNKILMNKVSPSTIDFMDSNAIKTVEKFYPCGLNVNKSALLLINIDGFKVSMDYQIDIVRKILVDAGASDIVIANDKENIERIWTARRSSFAATAKLAPDVLSDDVIVPRSKIEDMIEGCHSICNEYELDLCMVGHLGDGNIHPQIALNIENEQEYRNYLDAKSKIYKLVLDLGGTISAEHGIGIEKLPYIDSASDKFSLDYMRRIKRLFDPNGILNPGKIFDM